MDAYPRDLLTGVFPLVFAVDSTIPNASSVANGDELSQVPPGIKRTSSTRSLFDRFLDAIASHLSDNDEHSVPKASPRRTGTDAFASLLRGDDMFGGADDSSDEEDVSVDASTNRRFRVGIGANTARVGRSLSPQNQSTAFAKSLKLDGFFERARILSVSPRHGFPPSKDVTGQSNRALKLSQARSALAMNPTNANAIRLKRILERNPIDGIINAGWLEKHAAALPSILLVVTTLQITDKSAQDEQDAHLMETLEHLRESLASKRECTIRLVCLADTPDQPTTPAKVDEWISRTKKQCELTNSEVTMLHISHDLETAGPSSMNTVASITSMQKLHREIRDASWVYYQSLCRRVKRKLNMLGHDNQPNLLPLAVRYSFKAGVFYEFLLKHTKALKYFYKSYRLLQTYYRYLLGKLLTSNATGANPLSSLVNPQADDTSAFESSSNNGNGDTEGDNESTGVEVTLSSDAVDHDDLDDEIERVASSKTGPNSAPLNIRKIFTDMETPFDMSNQCRKVADWLNFKLIQAGLQSASFSDAYQGILAASNQWRRHCQVFLKHEDINQPLWGYWSYVSQQRLVMAQLVERFPPRNIASLSDAARDELVMLCSSWRNYAGAAEATLRLGVEIRKVSSPGRPPNPNLKSMLRGKYIGSLGSEGFGLWLQEESKCDHRGNAMDMLNRGITQFESEIVNVQNHDSSRDQAHSSKSSSRSGARIYYLFGGILLGKNQHREAINYLEKALKFSEGWKGLELAIRRMLIECYEKYLPTQATTTDEQKAIIASTILDSYFNSEMSSRNLRRALNNFASLSGGGLKWHCECIDESSSSLPFSFAVTFPSATHATVGDRATVNVMIQSNLDYAVHIRSLTLLSMAGNLAIPSESILNAENASEGSNGGIIIQAKTVIYISTQIELPRDIGSIATDEGGNGGETLGIAGKGSFAKSARPRTAGLTAAAGARLISETLFRSGPQERNPQWSVRALGGKPLRCDGLCLSFYPVHVEKASSGGMSTINIIELVIEKKRPSTSAEIKRTPFEEDNYLASAWSRPPKLPFSRGPRCLRVLGPIPQMTVTNLTELHSGNKVIEGTVNRILLKLEAGPDEICKDIKFKIDCSSMLLALDGSALHLDTEISQQEVSKKASTSKHSRTPVLVCQDDSILEETETEFGYSIPKGWKLLEADDGSEMVPGLANLIGGEETFIFFDIYRPHRLINILGNSDEPGGSPSEGLQICQTDFDVKITYIQAKRKALQQTGRRRRKPFPQNASTKEDESGDATHIMTLDFTGSVLWTSPLLIDFSDVDDAQKCPPCGNLSSPQIPPDDSSISHNSESNEGDGLHLNLIDGARACVRCSLWSNEMPSDIGIDIAKVWFEASLNTESEVVKCDFLIPGDDSEAPCLFEATGNEICRLLGKGKKLGVVWTVEPRVRLDYKKSPVSTTIGSICIDWSPTPLEVPPLARTITKIDNHGPLALREKSTLKFRGPKCCVERAPLETIVAIIPPTPKVGIPFEVVFTIKNTTIMNQVISVSIQDTAEDQDVLVAGFSKGDKQLSPQSTHILSYYMVATKAGKVKMPSISISSPRYKTWIVHKKETLYLFVLP